MSECCGADLNEFHRDDCPEKICHDCGVFVNKENHHSKCPIIIALNGSYAKDKDRWTEGYITQSTENVRKRVLAHKNGVH